MKKYIVTGTDGFIGSRLKQRLEQDGHEVYNIEQHHWPMIEETLDQHIWKCDGIFHVGAIADTTLQDPNKMLYYNYTCSKKIFDLARKFNKKVVYSSSAAVYGTDDKPTNIYGWSKLLAEEYGVALFAKNVNFVALRYFNVYGPGESHKGKMASVAYQAWNEEHLGNFKLFPGKPKRDFVYIDDVVDANIHAMDSWAYGVYEVGSGKAETFENLIDGMGVKYTYHNEDKIPSWYQFFTQANKEKFIPGWQPKYNILEGTKKYKEYLNG